MQLPQGATKSLDFAFVSEFLALGELDEFQNFFHLIHGTLEGFDDLHYLVDCLTDGGTTMLGIGVRMTDALGKTLDPFNQRPRFGSARRGLRCGGGFTRLSRFNARCLG